MSMAKARLDDRSTRRDRFHQKAKREGFAARAVYKITQLLPSEGDDRQYRIKCADEPHERVVKESQLHRDS